MEPRRRVEDDDGMMAQLLLLWLRLWVDQREDAREVRCEEVEKSSS